MDPKTLVQYTVIANTYFASQVLTSECNSIYFWNNGANNVTIDSVIYPPGTSYRVDGNIAEVINQTFNIQMDPTLSGSSLVVYRKFYV